MDYVIVICFTVCFLFIIIDIEGESGVLIQ